MSFLCHLYTIRMLFVCHSYVKRMQSYVTHMSYRCYSNVFVCHLHVTRMCSYIICMYWYVIHMSLVCTLMSSVCHSYVLVCHLYVTRMYSYVICMSLICGFTVNLYYMQMLSVNIHNTVLVRMYLSKGFQLIIYFSCLENVQKSSAFNH